MNAFQTTASHPVSHIVFDPSGARFAVVQGNFGATLYSRAGQVVSTIPVPRVASFSGVAFLDDGARLALGSRKGLHVFDVASGVLVARYHGWQLVEPLLGVRENTLITATLVCVRKADLSLPSSEHWLWPRLPQLHSSTTVLSLAADGTLAVGIPRIHQNRITLFAPFVGNVLGILRHNPSRTTFAFAPNNSRLAVCDGMDVCIYDVPELTPDSDAAAEMPAAPSLVKRVRRVGKAPKPHVVLEPIVKLGPPAGAIPWSGWRPPVAFTPDGTRLFIRRPRNRVQLWDIASACQVGEWSWQFQGVTSLSVAPDGLTAAAGGRYGNVVLWDLE